MPFNDTSKALLKVRGSGKGGDAKGVEDSRLFLTKRLIKPVG